MPRQYFTSETAKAAAARSVAARRAKRQHLADALATAQQSSIPPDFPTARMGRLRKLLTTFDEVMSRETDPAKLRNLAAAAKLLHEQERQLAGRPLPSRRDARRLPAEPRPPAEPLPDPEPDTSDPLGHATLHPELFLTEARIRHTPPPESAGYFWLEEE